MSRPMQLEGTQVRVRFAPSGDRYSQRIELLGADSFEDKNEGISDNELPSLLAIEQPVQAGAIFSAGEEISSAGLAGWESWPLSPPLQEVHLEDRDAGQKLALMVGRAGRSHWSVSCELRLEGELLSFDVACRIKETAVRLGSSYQLSPGLEYVGGRHCGELRSQGVALCEFRAVEQEAIEWDATQRVLTILPPTLPGESYADPNGAFPRTIRWRYELCFGGF